MFTVIILMLCGIVVGRVVGSRWRNHVSRCVTVLIWLLLFMLGIEVGADPRVTRNIPTLGVDALIIATGCVVGSVAAAWIMWRLLHRKNEGGAP